MRILIKYLILLIVFASCKHETNNTQKKKEIDFDAVSNAVCNCYVNSGLNSLNEELSALQEKDAPREDLKKLTEKAEVLYTKMKSCIDSVELKYGKIDSDENKQKAENALKKNCPQLAPFYDDIK